MPGLNEIRVTDWADALERVPEGEHFKGLALRVTSVGAREPQKKTGKIFGVYHGADKLGQNRRWKWVEPDMDLRVGDTVLLISAGWGRGRAWATAGDNNHGVVRIFDWADDEPDDDEPPIDPPIGDEDLILLREAIGILRRLDNFLDHMRVP